MKPTAFLLLILTVVCQPVCGQPGLVRLRVVLAGVELLFPVRHGLAVGGEAFYVPYVSLGVEKALRARRDGVEHGLQRAGRQGGEAARGWRKRVVQERGNTRTL